MVFQKKGAVNAKKQQPIKKGKKQLEVQKNDSDDFNDSDDSGDSDEEMPMQKTPQSKTPKGKQSLSAKKVSFDVPSKQTPNKNNSLNAKKQPTPAKGKTAMQAFKGVKGNKAQQMKAEEDDDDDDDDDDDEDFDEDMDEDDSDEESIGMLMNGGDDDDDDDDDDEDDDDDDDDDEEDDDDDDDDEEEEEQQPKGKKQKMEQNKQKPIKEEKETQSPKAKAQNKEMKAVSPKAANPQLQSAETERRRERDSKNLYVGNLPKDISIEELKSLSPDIKNVIIPRTNRNKMAKKAFAFLSFESEAKTASNYEKLKTKKLRGQLLNIDFVGEKSKNRKTDGIKQPSFNERKLFVSGIPLDATIAEVGKYFPKAFQITLNASQSFRSATINFLRTEECSEAFEANKEVVMNGQKLVVVHSTSSGRNKKNKRQRANKKGNQGGNPAKKMKKESDDEE